MTKLSCTAGNCSYNQEKYCCKGEIVVEGTVANESKNTCCGSFKERKENTSNAVLHPSQSIDVDCEAKKCGFNENCKCTAKQIGIAGAGAARCEETACASFSCGSFA
ncbi:hypothetical protein FACS1894111_12440 [Clostridia bacterium]|nr:hypothetical protein FACS1894111_12440 [Clostridia bacterium]